MGQPHTNLHCLPLVLLDIFFLVDQAISLLNPSLLFFIRYSPKNKREEYTLHNMPQLIWLVTGCSSGIGEAFVTGILSRGDKVIGTCRNDTSRLKHLQDAGAKILQLDITASQESLGRTIQQAIEIYGRIDVLVNNAGYLESGMFEEVR